MKPEDVRDRVLMGELGLDWSPMLAAALRRK